MKAYNLSAMMHRRGHEVLFYGTPGSIPECSRLITTVNKNTWDTIYGNHKPSDFYAFDQTDAVYLEFYKYTKAALLANVRPWQDLVLCPWGWGHKPAVDDVPTFIIESGIGYPVTFSQYRVFESYAWMNMFWGKEGKWGGDTWYDTVIPNYVDPEMFEVKDRSKKGDYFLYFGRLNADKGIGIAIDITREIGAKLVICGQGDPKPWLAMGDHVSYHEPVGMLGRKEILANAKALFAPTRYFEPWGGVVVEAQISGTPVITTDWGGFVENVLHGITGYRCRTYDQFLWAAKHVTELDSEDCYLYARDNFTMERVAPMYEEYFQSVLDIKKTGWYERHPDRLHLDAYKKTTPSSPFISTMNPIPQKSVWESAQEWESNWWGNEENGRWEGERVKQTTYARLMGIPEDFDMGTASIVDIGAGPMSMLLRVKTSGYKTAVDPLKVPIWVEARYIKNSIVFKNAPAETWRGSLKHDEAWLYNVLQHVEDPIKVLETAKESADTIRLFEWRVGLSEGHLHMITEQMIRDAFPADKWMFLIYNVGDLWTADGLLTGPYIAIQAVRR
jgi:glycosyltransferase involved in cell wall biosynthesis